MRDSTEGQRSGRSNRVHRNSLIRKVLMAAGTVFVGIGVVGIFLPVLPTTPFLLLAGACYARSSERFYNWLLNHRWFGKYIRPYREGKGIPLKGKALSISLIWLTTLFSVIFVVHSLIVRVILIVIAMGVTIYLLSLPTLRE
ncbi:MAG: YbaN family protein [Syntrophaceae bacterium]|nr:YbaN family protein [Syntrophaceae bacterium]